LVGAKTVKGPAPDSAAARLACVLCDAEDEARRRAVLRRRQSGSLQGQQRLRAATRAPGAAPPRVAAPPRSQPHVSRHCGGARANLAPAARRESPQPA
jgi:hypothetical protein